MTLLDPFNLPAPLLQWANERLTRFLPESWSIALWGALGALLCMELYRVFSPQRRIGRIKQQVNAAQHSLAHYDGEFEGAWPLLSNLLSLSLLRVALVLPATLLSAYPVIVLLVWMHGSFRAGWEFIFLPVTCLVALACKILRKID
jgi:hypothetical protein